MHFKLLKVILWPREGGEPRVVKFEPSMVNVISGASKTGKSSVIPIIDYCLGSEKCAIPVGVIRETCSWFGVLVDTLEGQKLLARREPGSLKASGDMLLLEGTVVEVPSVITEKNHNVDYVKAVLNRLSGLSNLQFEPGTDERFKSRVSFRDLMAFLFQPQNIIANPDVLFFKADTTDHREKLKTIFPYVLGAISPELLQARHELERLSRLLRRKEGELKARQDTGAAWQREGFAWARLAIEYGLLPTHTAVPDDWPSTVDLLRKALRSDTQSATPTLAAMDVIMNRLTELRAVESKLTMTLNQSRQRLHELRRLDESSDEYRDGLRIQRDRLGLSAWIRDLASEHPAAVLEPSEAGRARIDQLCQALEGIELRLRSYPGVAESLGKETLRQREAVDTVLSDLAAVRAEIRSLEGQSDEARKVTTRGEEISRFLGRLQEALRLYDAADTSSELNQEISTLRAEVERLAKLVSEHEIARKLENALNTIQDISGRLIPKLDGEWPDAPIRLVIQELTVRVIRDTRDDFLWEVGSGANWLAYHIALTLALQGYFLRLPQHPVPALLVYDQPSQVYFPARRAGRSTADELDPTWENEDVIAVRKVFTLFDDIIKKTAGRLQIIVLDHADEEVWGGLENVHPVEEWRGKGLVPQAWL
jgi:methyl-accepting chemotaxis protein